MEIGAQIPNTMERFQSSDLTGKGSAALIQPGQSNSSYVATNPEVITG